MPVFRWKKMKSREANRGERRMEREKELWQRSVLLPAPGTNPRSPGSPSLPFQAQRVNTSPSASAGWGSDLAIRGVLSASLLTFRVLFLCCFMSGLYSFECSRKGRKWQESNRSSQWLGVFPMDRGTRWGTSESAASHNRIISKKTQMSGFPVLACSTQPDSGKAMWLALAIKWDIKRCGLLWGRRFMS